LKKRRRKVRKFEVRCSTIFIFDGSKETSRLVYGIGARPNEAELAHLCHNITGNGRFGKAADDVLSFQCSDSIYKQVNR
jgi:hypothetical protein